MVFKKLILLVITITVVYVGIKINSNLLTLPPLPKLKNTWWGPGEEKPESVAVVPFKINIPDETLQYLTSRLNNARPLVPSYENIEHQYGINTKLLDEIVTFWKTKYDWREREAFFNKYTQYKTKIQGLNVHFVRVQQSKDAKKKTIPVLLLHGWPGSIRELYGVAQHLIEGQTNESLSYDLIIPSLPGYGFSDGASKPGLGIVETSVIFNNLMERLGFNTFYIAGVDWGSNIASKMAVLYPNKILGIHCTMCYSLRPLPVLKLILGNFIPSLVVEEQHASKMYPLIDRLFFVLEEMGYLHLQSTKPDAIGVALNDSPIGLAAYILDRFIALSDPTFKNRPDGGLKGKFSYTDLLDNVMIYWLTNSITTSMRYYANNINLAQGSLRMDEYPIEVPAACARFPHEVIHYSDVILRDHYTKLVQTTDFAQGGHFSGFEEPKLLADDIRSALEKFEVLNS